MSKLYNVYLKKCRDIKVYEDEYLCTTNKPYLWIDKFNEENYDEDARLTNSEFVVKEINKVMIDGGSNE